MQHNFKTSGTRSINERMNINLEKTQIIVEFSLIGDEFPIDNVTEILEITPTKTYKKGDVNNRPYNSNVISTKKIFRKETVWEISTDYQESVDVSEQLDQVIKLLKNKETKINRLKADYDIMCLFSIVIKMENGYSPAFHLNNEQIEFANRIKAEFDIDLYANPYEGYND